MSASQSAASIASPEEVVARIERLPASWWQVKTRIIVGTATFFDAFDALAIASVLPALVPMWKLTPPQIGLLISAISVAIFGTLHVPFFYFVGFLSGFLSLVPYLGVVLAMLPPILVGIGQLEPGQLILVVLCVVGLHLVALNVLYPKLLGSRLKINPLAVTIALLFWGAIWGAIGLVLAIPITGAMKIVFDHVESMKPYADWLGE